MASELKHRGSMLTKILGPEVAEGFEADIPEASRDARPAVPTPMLDLVLRDGSIESFSYAYLTRIRFDPRGRMALHFGDAVAIIEGRNLSEIRDKIRLHKKSEIFEGIEAEEALKPESAAHVESIRITSADEEEKRNDAGNRKRMVG